MDDNEPKKKKSYEIGQNLEELSVDELNETVLILKEEITRLETASAAKSDHLSVAEALFSKS